MAAPKRLVIAYIGADLTGDEPDCFRPVRVGTVHARLLREMFGLPDDARLVEAGWVPERKANGYKFEHRSFPVVPEGGVIPEAGMKVGS